MLLWMGMMSVNIGLSFLLLSVTRQRQLEPAVRRTGRPPGCLRLAPVGRTIDPALRLLHRRT